MIDALREHVRKAYRFSIGKKRQDLVTPALILDLDVARKNIKFMAERIRTKRLRVAVDDEGNAAELSEAARAADATIGVLIEVDVGMGRGGVRGTSA